jgi:hypothetical protein
MKKIYILVVLAMLCGSISAYAVEMPPLPFYDQEACTYEGCEYGVFWIANRDVKIFKDHNVDSPIAFIVKKGEKVEAVTGFTITEKAGITKVIKPIKMGYLKGSNDNEQKLNLKPGEIVYTLHYAGEGHDLFWYKGKLYTDQISSRKPDPDPPPPGLLLQVISRPIYHWWVKIKNKKGQIGWTVDSTSSEFVQEGW